MTYKTGTWGEQAKERAILRREYFREYRKKNPSKFKEYRKKDYQYIKNRFQNLKDGMNLSCQRCGYNKCLRALDFHHRDPTTKFMGIAKMYTYPMEKIKEEIDKCDVYCANCHREKHAGLF